MAGWVASAVTEVAGVEAVVAALRGHPRSAEAQEAGCAALGRLVADSAEYRSRIGAAGGAEAAVPSFIAARLPCRRLEKQKAGKSNTQASKHTGI